MYVQRSQPGFDGTAGACSSCYVQPCHSLSFMVLQRTVGFYNVALQHSIYFVAQQPSTNVRVGGEAKPSVTYVQPNHSRSCVAHWHCRPAFCYVVAWKRSTGITGILLSKHWHATHARGTGGIEGIKQWDAWLEQKMS